MSAVPEPLLTPSKIAARLNVSIRTVNRLIHRGDLRAVRIGRQWRVRVEDVEQLATPADDAARPRAGEKSTRGGPAAPCVAVAAAPALDQGVSIAIFKKRDWGAQA